ncbi:hypothetical protein F5X98DRAFT_43435 [Xylaria grammica]|nr:hypothetical protein F5X98DRAFT_43435 [Xylaria grammica]
MGIYRLFVTQCITSLRLLALHATDLDGVTTHLKSHYPRTTPRVQWKQAFWPIYTYLPAEGFLTNPLECRPYVPLKHDHADD